MEEAAVFETVQTQEESSDHQRPHAEEEAIASLRLLADPLRGAGVIAHV